MTELNYKYAAKALEEAYKELKRYRDSGAVLDWEVCNALVVLATRYVDKVKPERIMLDAPAAAESIAAKRLQKD